MNRDQWLLLSHEERVAAYVPGAARLRRKARSMRTARRRRRTGGGGARR